VLFDEDISTGLLPSSLQDKDDVAVKFKFNEFMIGLITRARTKLLKQKVNSLRKYGATNMDSFTKKIIPYAPITYKENGHGKTTSRTLDSTCTLRKLIYPSGCVTF
jgi:hypothetical protein